MTEIKFTKDQFAALLKLVYIGDWVINAGRTTDRIKEFEDLNEYLFSKTSLFGLEECSDDEEPKYPSRHFEESEVREHIDNYNTETFWDILAEELAKRQIRTKYSEDDLKNMDQKERVVLLFNIEDEIKNELTKSGLDNFINPLK